MDFPISTRSTLAPQIPSVELQKPAASLAETTVLPAPLSVDEARKAALTALDPREKTAIIRALLSDPPASAEALSLATQIAAQAQMATISYSSARETIGSTPHPIDKA